MDIIRTCEVTRPDGSTFVTDDVRTYVGSGGYSVRVVDGTWHDGKFTVTHRP